MPDLQFADDASRSEAMVRAADALLRTLGPSEITLVLPVDTDNPKADLGLGSPIVEQVVLSPVVVRRLPRTTRGNLRLELLLSASVIQEQLDQRDFDSADDLFDTALGVLCSDKLLRIESVGSDSFAGSAYLYHVNVTD